jgi:hypothetical protein
LFIPVSFISTILLSLAWLVFQNISGPEYHKEHWTGDEGAGGKKSFAGMWPLAECGQLDVFYKEIM